MLLGDRIAQRMQATGLSQAELARRVGISQQAVGKLVNGNSRSTSHIARIARALSTTAAYLEGELDDPDENAPPPMLAPRVQHITMQVALPSEAALTRMFAAILEASPSLHGDELARELARRLPRVLGVVRGSLIEQASGEIDEPEAQAGGPAIDHPAQRRAQRT